MDPPVFEPDHDLLVWRKKVATWVELITTAANKGADRTYKSVAATLAHHLYERGLRQAQKSLVDEAQVLGKINYKQDDQIKAVQEIVDLVAVDPPIAVVTRLIDSFNKITTCKKRNNEDLNRFVSRYRGLAAEHLMKAGATSSSQVGEVLAINLLQNANLPESTLTNAKINLIQLAESRKKDPEEDPFRVSTNNVNNIVEASKELEDLKSSISGDSAPPDAADIVVSVLPVIESVMEKLKTPWKELERAVAFRSKEAVTQSITTTGPRCILSLEDAVTVLRSLAQTVNTDLNRKESTDDIQAAVKRQIQSLFGSLNITSNDNNNDRNNSRQGNQNKQDQNRYNGKRNRQNENFDSGSSSSKKKFKNGNYQDRQKSRSLIDEDCCKDCGSSKHVRGDARCDSPSYFTMKIREAKQAQEAQKDSRNTNDGNQNDSRPNENGYFRADSKRTKGKRV